MLRKLADNPDGPEAEEKAVVEFRVALEELTTTIKERNHKNNRRENPGRHNRLGPRPHQ